MVVQRFASMRFKGIALQRIARLPEPPIERAIYRPLQRAIYSAPCSERSESADFTRGHRRAEAGPTLNRTEPNRIALTGRCYRSRVVVHLVARTASQQRHTFRTRHVSHLHDSHWLSGRQAEAHARHTLNRVAYSLLHYS